MSIYGWLASLIAPFVIWSLYEDALRKIVGNTERSAQLFFLCLAAVFVIPFLLRRRAKRRMAKIWKRQRMGLQ